MGTHTGLLNDSPLRIGRLPDAVRPLYHLLRQCVANTRFTPASIVDTRMKNELPSGTHLPFLPIVIYRRLNDILAFAFSIVDVHVRSCRSHLSHHPTCVQLSEVDILRSEETISGKSIFRHL
jgi:hypothetical protein